MDTGRLVKATGRALNALLLVGVAAFGGWRCVQPRQDAAPAEAWAACGWPIAHGLGGHEGNILTNSREAFLANYAKGFRVFEVDLIATSDGALVATHDWETPERFGSGPLPLTSATFTTARIHGRFTPLSSREVLELAESHRDVRLVLDLKSDFPKSLETVVQQARAIDPTLLDRVVPELSHPGQLEPALDLHRFRTVIYSLDSFSKASDDEAVAFVARRGVPVVSLHESRFNPDFVRDLAKAGAVVYVHTVNDPARAAYYLQSGVRGIYTDSLPADTSCGWATRTP